jgi:hypothetical protein
MTTRGRYTPGILLRGDTEGTGTQGVMLFWDDTLKKWVPTELGELIWDDTNKTLQPVAMTVKDTSGTIIFHVDDDEMYFTAGTIPIAAGMSMGLLLSLTYAA